MNVNFFADKEVSAADLNSIVTDLGGESPGFEDGVEYSTSELNRITAALVGEGVSIDAFMPTAADGVLTVTEGVAFFADGAKFRLDEAVSMTLDIADGYIYLQRSDDGTVELLATGTEPPEGAILLALLISGAVHDRRTYAVAKAEGSRSIRQKIMPAYIDCDVAAKVWQIRAEIHPAFTNPAYIIFDDGRACPLPEQNSGEYYFTDRNIIGGSEWASDHERISFANGIITIECRGGSPRSGYVELR